ncbi:hypothetical protein [Nostoc sp. NZL]|uniref:hypothetical protein n=1 Tax=Nostoc sp. NZL TaxID=2650612 RepID=UPI0018C854D1|nr:hypothetical protein [Nostoc sp. NZL]
MGIGFGVRGKGINLKPFPFPLSPLTEPYWGWGNLMHIFEMFLLDARQLGDAKFFLEQAITEAEKLKRD